MIYIELFLTFFKIGLFTIGGGYASLPLIQDNIVEAKGWLTPGQFTDLLTIAEITPGPIAVNAATFVGTQVGGLVGAICCTLGVIAPSLIISLLFAYIYYKYRSMKAIQGALSGLRPAVVGMIMSAGLSILIPILINSSGLPQGISDVNIAAALLFAAGLVLMRTVKPKPIVVMLGFGLVGLCYYYLFPLLFKG